MSSNVMAKKKSSPQEVQEEIGRTKMSRRRIPGRKADTPAWFYPSSEERELIRWVASLNGRSLSSYVLDVVLKDCLEQARLYNRLSDVTIPGAAELLASVQKFSKK